MAKFDRKAGATSQIFQVFIQDSSSTTGAGLTGLVFNSGSLVAYYHRDTDTTATAISLVTMTVGTFTSSGFKEIDATNMPGWYQLCPPDAALASGAASVAIHLKGATNMAPLPMEIDLAAQVNVVSWNGTAVSSPATAGIPDVNVKNINNVAASSVTTVNANIGLTQPLNFTGTGASALAKADMVDVAGAAVSTSSAQIGVNAVNLGGTAQTGRDVGLSVLLSSGTGAGQLDFTSGVVKSNLSQILGTALTETAGQLAAAFKKFFNIGSPASTMDALTLVATATSLTNAPTSGDLTAAMKTSVTTACTASTPTAAAVTGAVGSVTARVTANTDQFAGQTVTAAAGVTLPASVASPTNITAGTITTATNLTNAPTSGDFTAAMKTSLNAATPAVTVSDKTGFSLTTPYDPAKTASQAGDAMALTSGERTTLAGVIWAALTSGLTTVGSIGKLLVANIDAAISSRAATGDAMTLTTAYDAAKTAAQAGDIMKVSSGTGANQVSLSSGAVTVGTNNDKTGYTASTVSDKSGYGLTSAYDAAKTAAQASDIPTATENSDALLKRDMNAVSGEASRSLLNAIRFLRNKWSLTGTTLTVTKEDDTTSAWTATVTTDAAADPITSSDPA